MKITIDEEENRPALKKAEQDTNRAIRAAWKALTGKALKTDPVEEINK